MNNHNFKTKAGYNAIIRKGALGDLCGYVGINKDHPLYGVEYGQHCEKLAYLLDKVKNGPIGKRGIIPIFCHIKENEASPDIIFDVHGSITFSDLGKKIRIQPEDYWFFGYDCGHAGDNIEICNLDYCIQECESLAQQLKEVEDYWEKHQK